MDAVAEAFDALASPMTGEEKDEWLRRVYALAEEAKVTAEIAKREYERAIARADHMAKWVIEERAKGRPEHELIWGNCALETGLETAEQHAKGMGEFSARCRPSRRLDGAPFLWAANSIRTEYRHRGNQ